MLQILMMVMVVLFVIVIAFYAFGIAVQSKEGTASTLSAVNAEIEGCREARYALLGEVIRAFPNSKASTKDLEILMSIYPKADTEEREIAWETKYIPAVKFYMQNSLPGLTGEPLQKWCDLNDRIEENENALTAARERKATLEDHANMMGSGFMGVLSSGGEKMKSSIRRFEDKRIALSEKIDELGNREE